jgi:PKD repeat protein
MIYGESINMKMKRTALATAIVLTVAGGPVLAETSTVSSQFILDKTEIATGSDAIINLSLLGLDKNGRVDLEGEGNGSTIIAVVETELGTINGGDIYPGATPDDPTPTGGQFSAELRYIRLVQGKGQVSITYSPETIGDTVRTDIVKVRLQERVPTAGGGVNFVDIGASVEKTITINPLAIDPEGLRIAGFKPASVDPRGKTDCYTETNLSGDIVNPPDPQKDGCAKPMFDSVIFANKIDDGIQGGMMAGQEGAQILVLADNPNATGEVTVTLTSKEENDESVEYVFSDRMVRGQAIITLDQSVTKTNAKMTYGEYYMEATFEGFDRSSVDLVYPDILTVWSTGIPRGLKLGADKKRIAWADFDNLVDPNSQVSQGAELMVQLLDEFGNATKNCAPSISTGTLQCTAAGDIKIAIENAGSTLLNLVVPADSESGQAMPRDANDLMFGNQRGEVDAGTSYNLIAKAIDDIGNPIRAISESNDLSIQVVTDSLQAIPLFNQAMLAGVEFDFAAVRVIDARGRVRTLADGLTSIDPGAIILKNFDTGEDIQVNRKAEGNDVVQGLFKIVTPWPPGTRFLVSDRAGTYGEVWIDTPAILPALASEVRFEDAHGEKRQSVAPTKTLDNQQYIAVLPDIAFKMFDPFDNAINTNTGEFRLTSSNAASIDYRTPEGGWFGVPNRWIEAGIPNYRYTHTALFYDSEGQNAFAGEDNIEVNFTKPGLGSDVLTIGAEIPGSRKLDSIASYIETTDIPVNTVVAMTVETLDEENLLLRNSNTTVQITLAGEAGDTLTPRVRLLDESNVQTGQLISFENGRVVFVIDAGSRSGRFSIKFADANRSIPPKVVTFNVTEKIQINQLPVANFTAAPLQGEAPLAVTLDASNSTDSDGTIVLYKWSASDGQTASGKRVNMTFPNAGTYTISLVVTDDQVAQSTNTAQQTVTVTAKPVPKVAPIARLSISPTNGIAPLTVSLNGSGSTDSDGTIVDYAWTASDGQKAFGTNSQITFDKSGAYTITLTITDNDGLTATAQDTVTVSEPAIVEPPPITNPDSLGQAIIIAAGGAQPNNTLFDYSNDFTQRMYRLLKERGFTDADIHYMNPWQPDIDLDGYPDDNRQDYNLFDPEPELSAAFAQAAANLSAGQQFVFYLHGHARPDHFVITPSYELSASRLRDLLATLPAGVQQVIILDTCYSGSFADELAGVENRVVITSADESTLAWNTQFTSFADKFLRSLRHGETLRQAFIYTEDMILGDPKLFREQRPWLDDDGDGQYTSRDGTRAASIYLGQEGVHAAPPPQITLAHDRFDLRDNATSATLWVRTTPSQENIRKVQAVLINPNFAGSDYQGEATDFGREEVELIYNPAQDRHEISYDDFWIAGTWRILYQAQNTEGVWSDIVSGEVEVLNIDCNPCVKMVLNQSRYTANEQLRLDMEINGNAELDLYVVILLPDSIFITIAYPLIFSFPNAIQAYQTGVTITGEKRYPIMDFPLPANVVLGGYQACGVLAGTGNDPKNINDWLHWHCAGFEVY